MFLLHDVNAKPVPTHLRVSKSGTHILAAGGIYRKEAIAFKNVRRLVAGNLVAEGKLKNTG